MRFVSKTTWKSNIRNIRLEPTHIGPRSNPNFCTIDISLFHPPASYYLSKFRERTVQLQSLVRADVTPVCSVHDVAKSLTSNVLASYPPTDWTLIGISPDIRTFFKTHRLFSVDLRFGKSSIHAKRPSSEREGIYDIRTQWRWPISPAAQESIALSVHTEENSASKVHEQSPRLEAFSSPYKLSSIHPTLGLHETVARFAEKRCIDIAEKAALLVAQCMFHLADIQSPCKRLQSVRISIRQILPVRDDFQTARQIMIDPMEMETNTDTFASCSVVLHRDQYERSRYSLLSGDVQNGRHRAFLALGSNIGNRIKLIESAVREMSDRGLTVLRTSALYETKPMYLEDQGSFINGACEIQTSLSPMELLDQLKQIENDLGRVKTVENGPRNIDLDILLYDEELVDDPRLCVPHKRMLEREFVLRPLCDLIPNSIPPTPDSIATYQEFLERLPESTDPLFALTPLSDRLPPVRIQSPTRPTHLMAILNLTPDSFSDGGLHSTVDPQPLLDSLNSYTTQKHPVTILDIGGQSTRPHASQVSADQEISRVLPTIKAIRSDPSFQSMAISIDTYRASVAAEAINAGADIVNDVSAGQLDPEMLPTIAKLGCTCILMHMRGTPETMNTLTSYPDGIINGVGAELLSRVRAAEKAGVRRWRIMLDPGIGFAKTQAQNLELLRRFADLRDFEGLRGFPWVVGASRKGFIGKVTGVTEAGERKWGTATTVAAAVQGGADVVRVHDVREMGEVVAMADAIWRVE